MALFLEGGRRVMPDANVDSNQLFRELKKAVSGK